MDVLLQEALIVIVSIILFALLSMNPFLAYASTVPPPAAATAEEGPKPGTLIVITFENGTTKVVRSTSTNVLPVTGGYLVVDPTVVPSQPLPAKTISQSVVNQFYTAIAIAIGITITEPPSPPIIRGPSDCLPGTIFDPVNKQCDLEAGECPEGEIRGRSGYCAILPKECPPGTSIDEDPICEPGFNQDCPLGTKLNADKSGCEPIECSDGEILQGDDCVPEFATTPVTPTEPPAGEVLQEEPVPEPDPELAPDPGNEEEQNEGEESENENGDSDSGDGDGGGSEGDGGEGGESG